MKFIFFSILLILSITFYSCSSDWPPYQSWHVGPGGVSYGTTARAISPIPPTVDCDPGNNGCQPVLDNLGLMYDDILVYRGSFDTLYDYYSRNQLSDMYSRHNLHSMFPEVDIQRPGALDSLILGVYKVTVGSDSSIIIHNATSSDSITFDKIVFVYERDAR